MGPGFGLQRINVTSRGWEEIQPRKGVGDCQTRWGNDPELIPQETVTLSLSAAHTIEPGYCRYGTKGPVRGNPPEVKRPAYVNSSGSIYVSPSGEVYIQ